MDMKRAKQIMESHGVIDVNYMDSPVWIEQLHEDKNSAEIKNLESGERLEVPVSMLVEDTDTWME